MRKRKQSDSNEKTYTKKVSTSEHLLEEWISHGSSSQLWSSTLKYLSDLLSEHNRTNDAIDAVQPLATPRTQVKLRTPVRRILTSTLPYGSGEMYYCQEPDQEGVNIVTFTHHNKSMIKAASLIKLIDKVMSADVTGSDGRDFATSFFLTYRNFTNPEMLLSMFVQRYELYKDDKKQVELMQNVLMLWWKVGYKVDWSSNSRMMNTLGRILNQIRSNGGLEYVKSFLVLIQKEVERSSKECEIDVDSILFNNSSVRLCESVLERESMLFNINPEHLARQITLVDSKLLQDIRHIELFNNQKAFNNLLDGLPCQGLNLKSTHILQILSRSIVLADWMASVIIAPLKVEVRSKRIKFFVQLILTLIEMKNIQSAFTLGQVLLRSSIMNLKVTYRTLSHQEYKLIEDVKRFCRSIEQEERASVIIPLLDHDHKANNVVGPCIPHIQPLIKRISLIDEAFLSRVKVDQELLIHWDKYVKISQIINSIILYQENCDYPFEWNESIQSKLLKSFSYRQPETVLIKWSMN
ncbi:gefJ, partial [Acrasis kona]